MVAVMPTTDGIAFHYDFKGRDPGVEADPDGSREASPLDWHQREATNRFEPNAAPKHNENRSSEAR